MKIQQLIEQHWYQKSDPILAIILFPFSLIYELIIKIRKLFFWLKLKPTTKLGVPVVIIGNISVGGAGKTPLTKHLAQSLESQGIKVGIILRGYKAASTQARIVTPADDSHEVGDEALIYARSGLKVAIGRKRVEAGKILLQNYPQTQLILADDGMQHYYLQRDMEICVVDSSRVFGNQQLLPMGPLREPISRIKKVNALVVNGLQNQELIKSLLAKYNTPIFWQNLRFNFFYNPKTGEKVGHADLNDKDMVAIAAIGNPYRFFKYLRDLGVKFTKVRSFPDHYSYEEKDLPNNYTIITTEKDYTKLAKFNNTNIWVAMVEAELNDESLINQIKELIK